MRDRLLDWTGTPLTWVRCETLLLVVPNGDYPMETASSFSRSSKVEDKKKPWTGSRRCLGQYARPHESHQAEPFSSHLRSLQHILAL
jgi:hypothetical protein